MRAFEDAAYRLALAEGFLSEAGQDVSLNRWRSCVDHAQLAVEKPGAKQVIPNKKVTCLRVV